MVEIKGNIMTYNFEDEGFELGSTRYIAEGMSKNKLLMTAVTRYGIYYTDIKKVSLSRVINKEGCIKLQNCFVNVMGISGVEFHLNEYKKNKK